MSEKIVMQLTEEEFRSIVLNTMSYMLTEFTTIRISILQFLATVQKKTLEEVETEFKESFETKRADILAKILSNSL